MRRTFEPAALAVPVDAASVETAWRSEGFSFGVFRDPPGQAWLDFVHGTDEYVLVAEGRLRIEVGTEEAVCTAGDLVSIPKGVVHSLTTISPEGSVWFYGYGHWGDGNA